MRAKLEFHPALPACFSVRGLTPEWALSNSLHELKETILKVGRRVYSLAELARISVEINAPDELVLCGETSCLNGVGKGMHFGRLVVEGSVGDSAGAEMTGGELQIDGRAGNMLGAGMQGGLIRCNGNSGDYAGAALPGFYSRMAGGTILIAGSAGKEAGAAMRRGLVVIGENSGEFVGADMRGGTILVLGQAGSSAGINMRRGSLVIHKLSDLPGGFFATGCGDMVWLKIYLRRLAEMGVKIPDDWNRPGWQRFSGDHLHGAKGELYLHEFIK